ncbi:MAG: YihY/virulence factor BrkB family protein [Chroococcidiopsidaceae cyanobacterium CP_BM_ER_R8_30]|nr:YihY/virulence factor BrkB family protein [Chroococcidiopsidaceae cyanobacterium CP_BM_ER_R8_30]
MNLRIVWRLLKETFSEWSQDKAERMAAALAYYTIFSIAPLLVIVIAIAGLVFGQQAARGEIVRQIQGLVGSGGAQFIQTAIQNANKPHAGIIATIISVVLLFLGGTWVFSGLQDALNTIWEVQPKPGRGVAGIIHDRFLPFAMLLGIGFLLLVSLVLSAGLSAATNLVGNVLPATDWLWHLANFIISFAIITLLFAMIYRILPDVRIAWSDVWIGAAITSLLFVIGKILLGIYLGRSSFGSTYGAAGSLVAILVWVYYSAQILFFGAEFTKVYARRYGSRIVPNDNAIPLTDEARAQQGMKPKGNNEAGSSSRRRSASPNFINRALRRLTGRRGSNGRRNRRS